MPVSFHNSIDVKTTSRIQEKCAGCIRFQRKHREHFLQATVALIVISALACLVLLIVDVSLSTKYKIVLAVLACSVIFAVIGQFLFCKNKSLFVE